MISRFIATLRLKINSIGSKESRSLYKDALYKYLLPYKNKLSTLSQKRLKTNPLRILDTKIDFEIEILNQAPHILDYINKEDREHFDLVLNLLDSLKIKYIIDHKLVRGLDYYCKTVFEIQSDLLGSQSALCGGGRYDYLIEDLGGDSTPAIGFAAGIERLILALNKEKINIDIPIDVYIITIGEKSIIHGTKIAHHLRNKLGLIVVSDMLQKSMKSQMKEANKLNAKFSIIIGDNELQNNNVLIKDMLSGEQKNVNFDKIIDFF